MSYNADKVTFRMLSSRNMTANIKLLYSIISVINKFVMLAIQTPLRFDFAP